jgi:hypothetical protein
VRRSQYSFLERYGEILSKSGVASIPNAVFYYQAELGLSVDLVWFVCVLLSHRWTSQIPYPSLGKIGKRSGVSLATLRRYRRALEELKWEGRPLLEVVPRRRSNGGYSSNGYDLSTLLEALSSLVVRDRDIWFKRNPLAGDGHDDDDDVDNPVDNSTPSSDDERCPPSRSEGGASPETARRIPASSARTPSTVSGRSLRTKPMGHEEEPWEEDPGEREPTKTTHSRQDEPGEDHEYRPANSRPSASSVQTRGVLGSDHDQPLPPPSDWIDDIISDYTRDLHDDPANSRRNQTQARRIWTESGFTEERFVDRLEKARRKARAARVKKESTDGSGLPNRMPYFYKVLRDITGVD